jgi:osmoprotectant transport system permease protein
MNHSFAELQQNSMPYEGGSALSDFLVHVRDHLALAGSALFLAVLLAVPLGAALGRSPLLRGLGVGAVGVGRVVPSLAVLALMLPLLGVGFLPALVALVLLAMPPITSHTDLALRGVPEALLDAARGRGMSPRPVRRTVQWPLALPVVFTGIRTAAVEVIASATLAAFIGGGGLGEYIVNGLAEADTGQLLEGAASVAALALAAEGLLGLAERRLGARLGLAPAE